MNKFSIYYGAIRPRTLTASAGPVLLGSSLAYRKQESLNIPLFIFVLLVAILLQITANLVNDYYDHINKVDTSDRLGPTRVTASGSLPATTIRRAYHVTLALAVVLGSFLAFHGGTPIVIIGACSILFAYLYTAGPLPLSYIGLGEIFAFVFFGPVAVWGTYYLLTKDTSVTPALLGVGPGFISASLMAVNNMRDRISDKKSRKNTFAVRYSERASRLLPMIAIGGSVLTAVAATIQETNVFFLLASTVFLLFLKDWKRILFAPINKRQNKSLAAVGKYLFVYCLLMSVGYSL